MNLRHTAAVGLLLLASCATDMGTIDHATQRAENAAARAEVAARDAENSAQRASDAAARTERTVGDANDSARRANDIITRFCDVPSPWQGCLADGKTCWPTPEVARNLKIKAEACSDEWATFYWRNRR